MAESGGRFERFLRPGRKRGDIVILAMLITWLLITLGTLLGVLIEGLLGLPWTIDEEALGQIALGELSVEQVTGMPDYVSCAALYLSFIGLWVVFALVMLIPPANRPMASKLLFVRDRRSLALTALGALAGFGINSICVLASVLLGDVAIHFERFEPGPLLLLLFAVFVQSGAEEISCRLYLYQRLARRYRHPAVAAVASAVFFTLLHGSNPGVTPVALAQIAAIGILFAILIYYYDALGACIAMHTTWNFTQNIIYGLPNSGIVSLYSIFELDAAANGPFFDPVFGVEGSVGAVVLLVLACVGLVVYAKAHDLRPHDLWADGDASAREASSGDGGAGPSAPAHLRAE